MRIEVPRRHERFGAVRIHEVIQVVEIDSGRADLSQEITVGGGVAHVPTGRLLDVEEDLAVVVPVKGERRRVLAGVLSGIPNACPVILVSASERSPVDRYALETEVLGDFCDQTGRRAVAIHQGDSGVAKALASSHLPELVHGDRVRSGKGEAIALGVLVAKGLGCRAVGFVDADNYVPGAVHEYVKAFAAGLSMAPTPYAMVRISWQSKPKVSNGRLVFNRWGRSTRTVNHYLNQILSTYIGFGTEIITTGNAGEHALSMDLAMRLRLASGFAVEPHELVDLFEQFGGAMDSPHPEVNESAVDVYQVETRNPHFHEDKGESHVDGIRTAGLDTMAASPVCPPGVAAEIRDRIPGRREPVPVYPPLQSADVDSFVGAIAEAPSFRRWGEPCT